MITEHDLQEAIAECQGERNPNANTCIKLAAFYTIRNELFGKTERSEMQALSTFPTGYSYAATPTIDYGGDSEFAKAIRGRNPSEVWPVMDELMDTLRVLMPRMYDGVMSRL